ncbi:MAG: hypothetical protein QOG72_756 [Sphingomonadales bacterium]|jgi:hypothetical protein|nr:hypothetical protein [Sphingomonadales bacterium]
MRSGLLALALVIAGLGSPALPANWRQLSGGSDGGSYIDTDAITRKGDKSRYWREVRFPEPQTAPTGDRFNRMAALIEVNCRAKTFRYLRQRANLGDVVIYDEKDQDDSRQAIEPGSYVHAELRAVCFGEWPSGT